MADILGTIVASILDYNSFNERVLRNPAGCDPRESPYAPCDGRSIIGSRLAQELGITTAPDLRGRFLRGLNLIYSVGEPNEGEPNFFDINNADSDDTNRTRSAGIFQHDAFKTHIHDIDNKNTATRNRESCDSGDANIVCGDEINNAQLTILPTGGSETRPKNVSVYYYIKIND